jgi:tetratricopeptide (TPR) repeat protein
MKLTVLLRVLLVCAALAASVAGARSDVVPRLTLRRAEHFQAQKEYGQAIELYDELAAVRPQWAAPHVRSGEIYLTQGRFAEAKTQFSRARSLDESEPRALDGLAEVSLHEGDSLTAVELWEAALALNSRDTNALYRLAQTRLESSDFAAAADDLQRVLRHESDHQGAHYLLGLIYAGDQSAVAAEHLAIAAQGADPTMATRAQDTLNVLADLDHPQDEAEKAARLAQALLRCQQPWLALEQLERVLALQPDNQTALAYVGFALFSTDQFDAARNILRDVSEADPKNPLVFYFLGLLHRADGYLPTALWDLKRSRHLDPGNGAVYAEIGATYELMGRYLEAEEWFRAAVVVAPEEPDFRRLLARFYVDVFPNPQEGLDAARQGAVLSLDDPEAQDLLGWANYLSGNLSAARLALERALDLDHDYARAYYHLGVVCAQSGDEATASWAYSRAIDLDTEGTYRAKALLELQIPA